MAWQELLLFTQLISIYSFPRYNSAFHQVIFTINTCSELALACWSSCYHRHWRWHWHVTSTRHVGGCLVGALKCFRLTCRFPGACLVVLVWLMSWIVSWVAGLAWLRPTKSNAGLCPTSFIYSCLFSSFDVEPYRQNARVYFYLFFTLMKSLDIVYWGNYKRMICTVILRHTTATKQALAQATSWAGKNLDCIHGWPEA